MRKYTLLAIVSMLALAVGLVGFTGDGAQPGGPNTAPIKPANYVAGVLNFDPLSRAGLNKDISNQTGSQSETSIAVDPTNNNHLLASTNDLSGTVTFNAYESTDGGKTWTVVNTGATGFCYDTWSYFNAAGDAFIAYECSDQRVAYRPAGGTTWTLTKLNTSGSPDRDMITIDRSTSSAFMNSAYIGWDDYSQGNAAYLYYSRDNFKTWSKTSKLNHQGGTIGVNAATAPNGTVTVAWHDWAAKKIYANRSTDGAVSWSASDTVAYTFHMNTTGFWVCIPPQNSRCIVAFPQTNIAQVGTYAGRLYLVVTDTDGTNPNTNIYLLHSDDYGATWSAPVKVNDDTVNAYNFHPHVSASLKDGTVGVSFYSTRNDPGVNKKTDRYIAFSTDGGNTFGANVRVTAKSSNETTGCDLGNQYGDYQGQDVGKNGIFRLTWTDSRITANCEEQFGGAALP